MQDSIQPEPERIDGYALPPEWAEYLRVRAVPPDVAQARGYKHVLQGKASLGGDFAAAWGFSQKDSGLLMPLHGVLNEEAVQLRRDRPEASPDSKGRPRKFATPTGQRNVLVTSPKTRHLLRELNGLVVCEGTTRVDSLAGLGIPAVGITGVWNWKALVALADWDGVRVKGNKVFVCPDGDVRLNAAVHQAVRRLADFLRARGAESVHVVVLPDGQGLDDWLFAKQFPDAEAALHAMREHITEHVNLAPQPAPRTFEDDTDMGLWSCTAAADVRRVLEHIPEHLCVVRPGAKDRPWRLLVEQEGGRWTEDPASVGKIHMDATDAWQLRVMAAARKHDLEESEAHRCLKHAVKAGSADSDHQLLARLGAVFLKLQAFELLNPALSFCDEAALDADRLSLGAPNGVIDLTTRQILQDHLARRRYVTRSVPDRYEPEATHPYVEELLAHLDDADRDYLLRALGYAGRGNPGRQTYAMGGERNGGKTTLQSAIIAGVGDVKRGGYGMRPPVTAFQKSRFGGGPNEHQGNLVGIERARWVMLGEPKDDRPIDTQLVKDLSGGDLVSIRDVGEKAPPGLAPMCTLFFAINIGQLHVIDTTEGGWHLLEYPQLPALATGTIDRNRVIDVQETPACRQAMVALLVKYAADTSSPPADIPSVQAFTEQHRKDSIGLVGQWLETRLQVTGEARDTVHLDTLWETLKDELGAGKNDTVDGMERDAVLRLARELHKKPKLPKAKYGGKGVGRLWRGVKVLAEAATTGEAPVMCDECGIGQPAQDATTCAGCTERIIAEGLMPCPSCDLYTTHRPDCKQRDGDPPAPHSGPVQQSLVATAQATAQEWQSALDEAHAGKGAPLANIVKELVGSKSTGTLGDVATSIVTGLRAFAEVDPDALASTRLLVWSGGPVGLVDGIVSYLVLIHPDDVGALPWRVLLAHMNSAAAQQEARFQETLWERMKMAAAPQLTLEGGQA